MGRTFLASISLIAVAGLVQACGAVGAPCADLLPRTLAESAIPSGASRDLTALDLVRLRDIGGMGVGDISGQFLAVSPDRRHLAFQIRRADPASNSYCFGMAVMDITGGAAPRLVDQGGDYIQVTYEVAGFARNTSPGNPLVTEPQWSPDGQWVAYLRRDHGVTQVWRARADGTRAEPLTAEAFDIEAFAWISNGAGIVYSGRPQFVAAEHAIDEEARSGFLYGDRFSPVSKLRPFVKAPVPLAYFTKPIGGGAGSATSAERSLLDPPSALPAKENALRILTGPDGAVAWLSPAPPASVWVKTALHIRTGRGEPLVCSAPACGTVAAMWWQSKGRSLVLMAREGWHRSQLGIYIWEAGKETPRRVLETSDALLGCVLADDDHLICGYERSLTPRRLVSIDLTTGDISTLFDPNPEFREIRLGSVRRLTWTNAYGQPSYGDLVLPPDYNPGTKLPMIVVNYDSRGFLRGGTGDEYPIQLFASHGFAVLSATNPDHVGLAQGANTGADLDRLGHENWIDRKNTQSSIEAGVRAAVATGTIDSTKLGITGLSDGGSSVQWALINSHLFSAAATSSCCHEPSVGDFLVGPSISDGLTKVGYPTLMKPNPDFWIPISYQVSGSKVTAPLLMQLADREFITALEGYTALKELNKPVELYVFPDETHVKWQPAHRLAVYTRDVDWFAFWLKGQEDPDPAKQAQYQRWRALRSGDNSAAP